MSPALSKSPRAERDQDSDCEHFGIALCLFGGLVEERADPSILFVNEVTSRDVQSAPPHMKIRENSCQPYIKSSCTLCSPEGSDLYSTTPSTSTMREEC